MVKQTKNGFRIEIQTSGNPANDYVSMLNNMVDLFERTKEVDPNADDYYALELFRAMLPDYDLAAKMFDADMD